MKTHNDAAWLPALLAAGGMLACAAAGGAYGWGIVASIVWMAWYMWYLQRSVRTEPEAEALPEPVEQADRPTEDQDRAFVHTVSLHRHDWINQIQLLQGYAQLEKYDKVRECIDTMKDKAAQEGTLFQLGSPKLVLYLYRLLAEQRDFRLELELQPGLRLDYQIRHAEAFAGLVVEMIEALRLGMREGADEAGDSRSLTVEMLVENGTLNVFLEYEGAYDRLYVRERYEQLMQNANIQWEGAETDVRSSERLLSVRLHIPLAPDSVIEAPQEQPG